MGLQRDKKFTVVGIETEKRTGRYSDGPGGVLELRIRANADGSLTKMFVYRYRLAGDDRELSLGEFPFETLQDARTEALKYAHIVAAGGHPREKKRPMPSFAEVTEIVITLQGYVSTSKNPADMRSTFRRYVLPVIGHKGADDGTRADVIDILAPLWHNDNAKARILLARMRKVFSYCISQEYRVDNPADAAATAPLPPVHHETVHYGSVDYRDTENYIEELRRLSSHDMALTLGLEFLIETAGRHKEAFGSEWTEIHLDYVVFTPKNKNIPPLRWPCWVIPKERTKTKERDHVIPLTIQALRILIQALSLRSRHPRYIFPTKRGTAAEPASTQKLRDAIGFAGTAHGFRSTFSTWAQDFYVPESLAEAALAHKIRGVRGAYAHSVLISRRIYLMLDWSNYNSSSLNPAYIWHDRFIPEDPNTYPPLPDLCPDEWAALKEASKSNPAFTLFDDVKQAFKTVQLSDADPSIKLLFEFMALTASSPGQVLKALMAEVDVETGIWNIPGEHNKVFGQPFMIPLSKAAWSVAAQALRLDRHSTSLFPSGKGTAITGAALNVLCKQLNLAVTPMHFHAAFRLWCRESGVPEEIIDDAIGRKRPELLIPTEHPDTMTQRRQLMEAWAKFLTGQLPTDWRWR